MFSRRLSRGVSSGGTGVSGRSTTILWSRDPLRRQEGLESSTHRWDGMGPGQLCPFDMFNK